MKTFEFISQIWLEAETKEDAWKEFDKNKEKFLEEVGISEIQKSKPMKLVRR